MTDTRITSTTAGQYDLLLAMSQDSINAALGAMWDVQGDEMSKIEVNGMDFGVAGSVDATIGPPDIQVIATGAGRGSVLFRLTFLSGKSVLFNKATKKSAPVDVKNFKIAFKVDIALDDLHAEVTRYNTQLADSSTDPTSRKDLEAKRDKVLKLIDQFGKQAGDFSIQRLFLDFSTADISSLPASELKTPGLDSNQVTAFSYLLSQWFTSNKDSGNTTLGYSMAIDPTKANNYKVANVLMPTSVNLQTYPYKADANAEPKLGWSGDAARNCVTYCNMTEKRGVPNDRTLLWSGNFTTINPDKEKRVDGTALIRRGLFLDQFIVPMLRQYNDDMQIVAETMDIARDGPAGQRRFHWSYSSTLGRHPSFPLWTDPYFSFTANGQGTRLGNVAGRDGYNTAKSQGFDGVDFAEGVSWSWAKSCDTGLKSNNQDWHFPQDPVNWTDHMSGRNTSYSAVDVVAVPGQGRIKIRGVTEANVTYDGYYTRLFDPNLRYVGNLSIRTFWQVDIVVSSSEAAGMKCAFENQKTFSFDRCNEEGVPNDGTNSRAFIQSLKDQIPEMLKEKNSICKAINDALDATGKFTHPAAGDFNLQDPVFNRNGDLLVTAQYKAPEKDRLKFNIPATGDSVKQRDPTDPGKFLDVSGDVKAPIPKKGN